MALLIFEAEEQMTSADPAPATERLIIFDTTLRDGEQSPGASMTKDEKIRIARQLERLRVDVIEAGFPASSDGDFEAVRAVAAVVEDATIAALNTPGMADRLMAIAADIVAPERRSPEYLQRYVESEIRKWAAPIKASGINAD